MTLYATGSTGTIGRNFPTEIVPINHRLDGNLESFLKLRFKPTDIVIHAGAAVGPAKVARSIENSFQVNVVGTRYLALTALQNNISRFVYISTCHVYKFGKDFLDENAEIEPTNHYAEQKYLGEREVLTVFKDYPEKVCIIRVFSLLGPNMPLDSLGGGVDRVLNGEPNFQILNGDDVRDFQTPNQVARTIVQISKNPIAQGVFNLCSASGLQVSMAASEFMKNDQRFRVEMLDNIKGGVSKIPRIVGNNAKMKSLAPEVNLEWTFTPHNH